MNGLDLICIRTWLDNGFALYYDEREREHGHGGACRQRSTVRRCDLDKIKERDGKGRVPKV